MRTTMLRRPTLYGNHNNVWKFHYVGYVSLRPLQNGFKAYTSILNLFRLSRRLCSVVDPVYLYADDTNKDFLDCFSQIVLQL